ncbi:hypothetical protein M431DRAFT_21162 [Trichoderma harzianum CBS 226.95]|uniref:Transcription factor domain-containing protein n=1 Tax=Trichoderma harzianum CBS 226.95 TaxID=983964 RepID=A0A2T3ZVC3_TRIHA|nr:hypothetical protein M431DRAFT_21162 [Trichoderma harzianum CBS 226.95]PTB48757.1 hypothetical protein M431DRAFT_21162 [Trichoderma harzianum CBS 226.95]
MAITELIFPKLKLDQALLKTFAETLPAAAKETFSGIPGLTSYYRGKVIEARNVSQATDLDHSGLTMVLEWDKISSFNTFWASEGFAAFRSVMKPFMLSPVSPELYYSEIADSGNTTACRYTQYIKVDGGHSENKSVESSWEKLTQEIGIDTKSFHAWGIQESDGAFMGMNGWSSLEDSDHDLFSRLDRIEGLLLEAKSHRSAATKSHLADQPYAPLDYQFPTLSSRLAENQLCGETENSDVVVFGFDLHCLSSFRTKEFHQALLPLRVNDFEESLEQELKEDLFQKTLDTALTLLILALGSMSTDSQNMSYDPATTPGLDYFRAACQIVDGDRKSNYTLQHVQCHILMSVYFQSCLLPIQAFESIRVASEKIVLLLQMRKRIASDRSDSEEPGFYGFLACIALCRIVARARNGISWNRVMLKEPVIVREIILQLSKWYATLPPPIKFPLLDLCQAGVFSNGTLLDTQQAQLRAKFFSTHALLHWPNVVLLLEIQSPTTRQADDQVNHDSSHILNGAAKALEFATMSIYAFESLYSNPNLLMESNGGTFYAIMILLLSVYRGYIYYQEGQ